MTDAQPDPVMHPSDEQEEKTAHIDRVERRRDTVDWDEGDEHIQALLRGEFHDGESTS